MFDFQQHATVAWKLAVTNARDALLVCRLDERFNDYEIAYYLIQRGIPFHTLLPFGTVYRAPRLAPPMTMLPIRLPGYEFGKRDYDAYLDQRAAILSQPRARAALLRGGMVWRLAFSALSFDDVLRGPSNSGTAPNTVLSMQGDEGLTDDQLTEVELDLHMFVIQVSSRPCACAHTRISLVHSGYQNQTAIKSWFLLVSTFEGSSEDFGRWTSFRENWYDQRRCTILNPETKPALHGLLTASKWRDLMREVKTARQLNTNASSFAKEFIADACPWLSL